MEAPMKLVIGTMFALLLAGGSAYAQEPDKDKPKEEPQKHEEPRKGEQPARGKQDEPKEKPKQEPERRPDARPAQQNDRAQQQQQEERNRNQQRASQEQRSQEQQRAQQTAQHRDNDHGNNGGGHGRRVPEEKFRASFGSSHHFHVQRNDDRRFNYGGYYFTYNDTWPGDWDYNDDVYIDEIDGEYYLVNPRHPGVRLLVIVAD
jgi:hypothetical protein